MIKKTVHNSSLEVNYTQSAAQVLRLIEELQYRLKSRMQAIEVLRQYYENYNTIPALNEIEKVLVDMTADQIATHFDSYLGYLEAALTGEYDRDIFRNLCLNYAEQFYQKSHILPTFKDISLANQYNGLLACSEPEVKCLLGSEQELEIYLLETNQPIEIEQAIIETLETTLLVTAEENIDKESLLIDKYLTIINAPQDLLKLSDAERIEIKRIFKSEFRFVNCLKNKKGN